MPVRNYAQILASIAIAAVFVWLLAQFFYGDLGIIESREKQRTIAELKANIIALKRSAGEKYAALEKLTRDTEAIRAYALLYGMAGGIEENSPKIAMEKQAEFTHLHEARAQRTQGRANPPPFFLRHPILIALAAAICLIGGALIWRRQREARQRQYILGKARAPQGTILKGTGSDTMRCNAARTERVGLWQGIISGGDRARG